MASIESIIYRGDINSLLKKESEDFNKEMKKGEAYFTANIEKFRKVTGFNQLSSDDVVFAYVETKGLIKKVYSEAVVFTDVGFLYFSNEGNNTIKHAYLFEDMKAVGNQENQRFVMWFKNNQAVLINSKRSKFLSDALNLFINRK